MLFKPWAVFCTATLLATFSRVAPAQEAGRQSSLDQFSGDFFELDSETKLLGSVEVAGTRDFVDDGDLPQPPNFSKATPTLENIPLVEGTTLSPEMQSWVRWVTLDNLPPVYEDNRKWGRTEEVYNGFRFRREGMKLETYTKYRKVKQGTWSRYYIEFVEPEQKLEISVDNIRPVRENRFAFRIQVRTPLRVFGRISQWQRDIQLISLSTNADAVVSLVIDCECGMSTNSVVFPPDIKLIPRATHAVVSIESFEVHRISQLRGPLAEQLGKGIYWVLKDRLAKYNDKLVEKINRQLEKHDEKLVFKLHDELTAAIDSWTKSN